MKIIKNEHRSEFDKQLESIGRTDFVKRDLIPPHFPDHPDLKSEVSHGTLKGWLKKLAKAAVNEQNGKTLKK